jgi:hypothetical protein
MGTVVAVAGVFAGTNVDDLIVLTVIPDLGAVILADLR